MNSVLDEEKNKTKCQKFTPVKEVSEMLDLADYTHDLIGKKILEYSFGSGNILKEIVKRYIEDALSKKTSLDEIATGLSADIYGLELDPNLYNECIFELNSLAQSYHLPMISWSLYCYDALRWNTTIKFDYIVGNPPYISYHDIDIDNRNYIRSHFSTCKSGKFDYCYAFLEKGVDLLSPHGKMVQLIPSNVYKNVFADKLREKLLPGICVILEYPNNHLFESTLTSSSIMLYENGTSCTTIKYQNKSGNKEFTINKSKLSSKWVFQSSIPEKRKQIRFGEKFHASISVATQLNEAFVIEDESSIESGCLREAAAPRALRLKKKEYIIFPYYYGDDGNILHYSEKQFKSLFPNAYAHLLKNKKKLSDRDSDKSAQWFEYGRSQALNHLQQEKLLLSTVITNSVIVYELSPDAVPYSGIYITACDKKADLKVAKGILQSKEFLQYIMDRGLSVNGKSKRITCQDINDYWYEEA